MTQELYDAVEAFVVKSFTDIGTTRGITHFLRTTHWLLELNPDADDALKVAAVAHDIERSARQEDMYKIVENAPEGFMHADFLQFHQERGAEIMRGFLQEQGADEKFIARVVNLISKHEIGGDEDQNLLKDADSVSFFENNAIHFATKYVQEFSKEKVKEKLDWMFNRMTSDKAKEIARPWYEQALEKLKSA